MYRLHIGNKNYSSWSLRPWVLLSELNIPFEEVQHYFSGGYGGNPQFSAFSPSALVPCLEDGDLQVWDSLSIAEYVAEDHPSVWPADKAARAYARSATAQMHSGFSGLRNICSMTCGQRVSLFDTPKALSDDVAKLDALLSLGLERFGGPFLGGAAFTAVDAFFCPVAFRYQTYGLGFSDPVAGYLSRLLALPSMTAWYEAALLEIAREQAHEDEIAEVGLITADYRHA